MCVCVCVCVSKQPAYLLHPPSHALVPCGSLNGLRSTGCGTPLVPSVPTVPHLSPLNPRSVTGRFTPTPALSYRWYAFIGQDLPGRSAVQCSTEYSAE
ncbi:hypothetical protein K431DRAFT_289387 [Polychaeton citri CBS 116435]|uniref:Uncharacterized protein n=1 Tax=Polychaeton citri CBS 116435 TaxID=1314669 RepID=A0A9P4PYN8_9PEZI|nr:hypothetical protein K431DRAFT_289387 [Polychaeton citri CBS 116435]